MNARPILILAAVTLLAALFAAVAAYNASPPITPEDLLPSELVPGLEDRAAEVRAIEIVAPAGSITLERRDADGSGPSAWVVASSGGYPARPEAVRRLLLGLADLEPAEPKTRVRERYGQLSLAPPDAETGAGTGVTLRDRGGAVVASLRFGDRADAGGRYVLPLEPSYDDGRSFLVRTAPEVAPDLTRWVDATVFRVPRERVRAVMIDHPGDAEDVSISRPDRATSGFALDEFPAGRSLRTPRAADAPASSLSFVRFEGVVRRPADSPPPAGAVVTTVETFDGLRLEARTWPAETAAGEPEVLWLEASARPDAPIDPAAAAPPGVAAEDAPSADQLRALAEEEAAALNERLAPWRFRVPATRAQTMRQTMADLLAPEEPVGPPASGSPGPSP